MLAFRRSNPRNLRLMLLGANLNTKKINLTWNVPDMKYNMLRPFSTNAPSAKPSANSPLHDIKLSTSGTVNRVVQKPDTPQFKNTISVTVNGKTVLVPPNATILQACDLAGETIPRFCYHEKLSVAGNCRMCLVEVYKSPKPVASCAMPVMKDMIIKTNTLLVKRAREGVLEFLLANHPLDCPICDQGGECDLQDISRGYGNNKSRYRIYKRVVEDKNLGPLVKTVMTRCIHCTRCIRYSSEIAGVNDLGTTGRGNGMEIGTYIEKAFDSEISGNVIDLCPVGALTSKPFAFTARPWELVRTESIDVLDAVCCNIRIDTRGPEVLRILPRRHEELNEDWISDKTRFSYDGLKRQRLDTPLVRKGDDFEETTWQQALSTIRQRILSHNIKGSEIMALAGDLADVEGMMAMKDFLNKLGSDNHKLTSNLKVNGHSRTDYLFNTSIEGIDRANAILIVGSNPRMEAPIINTRIRKRSFQNSNLKVATIGPACDLALHVPVEDLGNNPTILNQILDGSHPFSQHLKAKESMIILGMGALCREDSQALLETTKAILKKYDLINNNWNGLNILHSAASAVGALDIGFIPGPVQPTPKIVFLLGADNNNIEKMIPPEAFVVYMGHHGDNGANVAHVVLPSPAYTEKNGTYVNTEGRVQRTNPATPPLKNARADWAIVRALSEVLEAPLPYNSLNEIRERMVQVSPYFANLDEVIPSSFVVSDPELVGKISNQEFEPYFTNFFMTNPISRSSRIMAKCASTMKNSTNSYLLDKYKPQRFQLQESTNVPSQQHLYQ